MDSLIKVLSRDIDVIYREDHLITFNGFDTLHEALVECSDLYNELSFEDQMYICAKMANEFAPLDEEVPQPTLGTPTPPGKNFIYAYEWYEIKGDYACTVFDAKSGDVVFHEWFKNLHEHQIMDSLEDIDGLLGLLLKYGELIEGDTLTVQGQINREDDDSLDT